MNKTNDSSRIKRITIGAVAAIALTGCGEAAREVDDGIETIGAALTAVSSQLQGISSLGYDDTLFSTKNLQKLNPFNLSPLAGSAFGSNWTTVNTYSGDSSGTMVSPMTFMGQQLNPATVGGDGSGGSFQMTVFGRFDNSMMIACALGTIGETGTGGYPANGEQTLTLDADNIELMVDECGMSESEADSIASMDPDPAINIVTTDTTDDSTYDKKMVMTLPAGMGGAVQTFMLRFNNDEVNILNVEDGDYDSRTLVAFDVANKVVKVEYYSGGADSFWYYRLFYDEENDQGRLVASIGGASNYNRYTLAGRPDAGGTFALSYQSTFSGSHDYIACVDASDGTIETDASLDCTVDGTDLADVTWLPQANTDRQAAGWIATDDETLTANWDIDTTFTESPQY